MTEPIVHRDGNFNCQQSSYITQTAYCRITSVTAPDGGVTTTSYSGNKTTVTDPAGHAKVNVADALGRLTQVTEDPSSLNYVTQYTWGADDTLQKVAQGSQTRTFAYDSLQHLTNATNPESGTTVYTYDAAGNLQTKADARTIKTTYSYDALNRLIGKTYSDGTPTASYTYDSYQAGSLASSGQGGVTQYYPSRDVMGRPLQSQVLINGQTYSFSYVYDLSGALTGETYPSGRVIKTTYDGAGRTNAVSGTLGTQQTNYVGSVQYWPHGAPQVYQYGNNVWPVNSFDKVLRPQETYSTVANNSSYWLLYITNSWNTNGTLNSLWEGYGPAVTWSNMTWYNGSFGYDHVNRLTSAGDAGWSRSFSYDQYANMSVTGNSNVPLNGLTPQILQAPYNPYNSNNRLVAAGYDAAGNMGTIGALSFWYDAEGRQTQSYDAGSHTTVNYTYDADGQRVQKVVSNGPTTVYIHDAFGQLAAEYASSAPTPPCTTCYLSYDHLGSVRLITDQNANVVSRHDYLPFGEEIPNGSGGRSGNGFGAPSSVNQMFTGQERDGETVPNADFFNARYFMGVLGNFTRPDPGNAGADLLNPQSWNAYAYVLGNPLANVDPSGMWACDEFDDPFCNPWWPPVFPPCFFFDCGGGGGGRGGSGGDGTSSNTPRSTPLPPNSFPGGETLGLPPGMRVPLPSPAVLLGLNLNLNCEFGVCVGGVGGGLVKDPATLAAQTLVQKILGIALNGPALAFELLIFNPSSAGGKSEIEFENANKRRWTYQRTTMPSGWRAPKPPVTDDLREECEDYAHARADKHGHQRYGREWLKDYEACIEHRGIENIPH